MKIGILSDTHIGKNLRTNTTAESRARLKDEIHRAADNGINLLRKAGADLIIHTADLFDKAVNDEADILAGVYIAQRCDEVMFGNHDNRNRKDQVSSMQLLTYLGCSRFAEALWEPGFELRERNGANLFLIPHCVSQQVFEDSLLAAKEEAGGLEGKNLLFLHCNYDNDLVTDSEQNLNLTEKMADNLLDKFDFIVMGHEHQMAKRKDGRVISVGTTHPTSFSDISDKFVTLIDTDTGEVEHLMTWNLGRSWTVDASDFIDPKFLDNLSRNEVQFIDVVGSLDVEMSPTVADVSAQVWESAGSLIALRTSKIDWKSQLTESEGEINLESLPEVMLNELEGGVQELLKEALTSVQSN